MYTTANYTGLFHWPSKPLCSVNSSLPPSDHLTNIDHFIFFHSFAFSRISTIEIIQGAAFSGRIILLNKCICLITYFFLELNIISLNRHFKSIVCIWMSETIYLFIYLKGVLVASKFVQLWIKLYIYLLYIYLFIIWIYIHINNY